MCDRHGDLYPLFVCICLYKVGVLYLLRGTSHSVSFTGTSLPECQGCTGIAKTEETVPITLNTRSNKILKMAVSWTGLSQHMARSAIRPDRWRASWKSTLCSACPSQKDLGTRKMTSLNPTLSFFLGFFPYQSLSKTNS